MTTYPLNTSTSPTGDNTPLAGYNSASAWDTTSDATYHFAGYKYLRQNCTDSAAAGTAFSTGQKTYNGAINWANSPATVGAPLVTIAELAKADGKKVGVVTTVPWSHATPATLGGAHNLLRSNYSAIANEMLNSSTLDVIMGCGNPDYDPVGAPAATKDYQYVGGQATWDALKAGTLAGGWSLVQSKAEFEALVTGPTSARVVGTAQVGMTLQQQRTTTQDWNGNGTINDADKLVAPAYGDSFLSTVPTLTTMTRGALNVLDGSPGGFFLHVEGGAVDWAAESNQAGRAIEEMADFNDAVQAVVDWVSINSNWNETLLLVTTDHGTGQPYGPDSATVAFDPIGNNGAGNMPGVRWESSQHDNELVPLYARGVGADLLQGLLDGTDPIRDAFVDNTDVYGVMYAVMPEPGALGLLAMGMAGLALRRRRH